LAIASGGGQPCAACRLSRQTRASALMPPKRAPAAPGSPYPKFARPSASECVAALAALEAMHPTAAADGCDGPPSWTVMDSLVREGVVGRRARGRLVATRADPPLSLPRLSSPPQVRTILSQNTTDATSARAFAELKRRFPTWPAVLQAPAASVADSIRVGGLADRKAAVVQAMLKAVKAETGDCELEHVRGWETENARAYLTAFNGVGPNTASCVLAFALGRPDFPVDTHVHRIATAVLGWAPKSATRDTAHVHLNGRVPDAVKVRLHVLLVEHGKRCPVCGGGGGGWKEGARCGRRSPRRGRRVGPRRRPRPLRRAPKRNASPSPSRRRRRRPSGSKPSPASASPPRSPSFRPPAAATARPHARRPRAWRGRRLRRAR
jgi:endonuclease-3